MVSAFCMYQENYGKEIIFRHDYQEELDKIPTIQSRVMILGQPSKLKVTEDGGIYGVNIGGNNI